MCTPGDRINLDMLFFLMRILISKELFYCSERKSLREYLFPPGGRVVCNMRKWLTRVRPHRSTRSSCTQHSNNNPTQQPEERQAAHQIPPPQPTQPSPTTQRSLKRPRRQYFYWVDAHGRLYCIQC